MLLSNTATAFHSIGVGHSHNILPAIILSIIIIAYIAITSKQSA